MEVPPRPLVAVVISSSPESMLLPLLDRLGRESTIRIAAVLHCGPFQATAHGAGSRPRGIDRWVEKLSPFYWLNRWAHPESSWTRRDLDALCAARGITLGRGCYRDDYPGAPGLLAIDIGIVYAPGTMDEALLSWPRLGWIGFRRLPGVGDELPPGFLEILGGKHAIELALERYTVDGEPDVVIARGFVPIEAQDVPESLAPKVEMMSRDLIIGALGVIGIEGSAAKPAGAPATPVASSSPRPALEPASPGIRGGDAAGCTSADRILDLLRFDRICRARRQLKRRTSARIVVRRMLAAIYLYCGYVQVRNALRRRAGSVPGVIVNFHRIADNHPDHWMTAGTDAFDRYVRFLRRWYRIVTVEEMRQRLATGRNTEHLAAITFDDGYLECAIDAAAALERHGASGAFYVCSGLCDTRGGLEHDRAQGYMDLQTVGPEEVRDLLARGFEIGSHSSTHADFRSAGAATIEAEISGSKARIEAIGGTPVAGLAIPFGSVRHCRREVFAAARRAGYSYVLSHFDGVNFPGEEGFHLRRVRPPLEGLLVLHAAVEGWRGLSGLRSRAPESINIDTGSRE